ncbi:hypothetical protein BC833DRAFT_567715 [Globomyces pollinis-pini]|nr:hypothetical protein BC833DRAFT_567715 [Globomyces pollinis-pini]
MLIYSILLLHTQSQLIFESQWSIPDCIGPPDSISLFSVSTPSYPPSYTFKTNLGVLQYTSCGASSIQSIDTCCFTSMNLTASGGYASSSTFTHDSVDWNHIPVSTNNNRYCIINPTDNHLNQFAFLANEKCINNYKCLRNSTLQLYTLPNCNGTPFVYSLTTIPTTHQTPIGQMEMSHTLFQNASVVLEWITDIPDRAAIANTMSIWHLISHATVIIYLSCTVYLLAHSYQLYRRLQSRFWLYMMFIVIFRLIGFIPRFLYHYVLFPNDFMVLLIGELQYICIGLDFLLTNLLTVYQIANLQLPIIPDSQMLRVLAYSTVVLVNLGLYGGYYALLCVAKEVTCTITDDMLFEWMRLSFYLGVFTFILDIIPVTFIVLIVLSKSLHTLNITKILVMKFFTIDFTFTIMYITGLLITFLYYLVGYFQMNVKLLGSDRAYFAFGHLSFCLFGIHKVLTALMIQRVGVFLREVWNSVKKTAPISDSNQTNNLKSSQ